MSGLRTERLDVGFTPDLLFAIVVLTMAIMMLLGAGVRWFDRKSPKVSAAAAEEPASEPAEKAPLYPTPILSNDDMTISGELDLLDDDPDGDFAHRETQPIPVHGENEDAGAIGEGHGLFSFYRKLADPKLYDLPKYPPGKPNFPYVAIADLKPHQLFDTGTLLGATYRYDFFWSALGYAGKTELDTNMDTPGQMPNPKCFFFHTVLLQFPAGGAAEVIAKGHLLLVIDNLTELNIPLSMFSPLTLEKDPQVYFATLRTVRLPPHRNFRVTITIEDRLKKPVKARVILPGLLGREIQ